MDGRTGVGRVEALEPRRMLSLTLLADLNTTTRGSSAREPVVIGSVGYFYANDGVHGHELWRTDGTAAGTWLVKDINPGSGSSGGFELHEAGGLLYFSAHDATGLVDLWRSDGTAEGTFRLTSVGAPSRQFLFENVAEFDGGVIVGSYNWGVWRSDGTPEGTVQVAPVAARNAVRLGDAVYFTGAPMPAAGAAALWKTDGTAEGTEIVRQFSSSLAAPIYEAGGRLYFWAEDAALETGFEPWSSDGTAEGTVPLGDLVPGTAGSSWGSFGWFDDALYFTATTTQNPNATHNLDLFRTDGTADSATLIARVGVNSSPGPGLGRLTVFNGALYFRGSSVPQGVELWRSDGTPQGTGAFLGFDTPGRNATSLAVYDGRLYFKGDTPERGFEMYSTDGSVEGTTLLREIGPGTRGMDFSPGTTPVELNGRLLFRADDALHGLELWSTDGTAEGTRMVADLNGLTMDFNPRPITPGPGGLNYFVATGGQFGNGIDGELWKTDGTAAGTSMVKDFFMIPPWNDLGPFVHVNGLLLFAGWDESGVELWRSDGTEAGTHLVKDMALGSTSGMSRSSPLVKVGERVFFVGNGDGNSSADLWVSDGTEVGTRLVRAADNEFALDVFSGIELDGKLLFLASWESPAEWRSAALYVSDGTAEGTTPVATGFLNVAAEHWTLFDGRAYFTARTLDGGNELWSTDATAGGTAMVADIRPGPDDSKPMSLVATPEALYFTADDGVNGRELWRVRRGRPTPERLTALDSNVLQVHAGPGKGVIFTTAAGGLYRYDGRWNLAQLHNGPFTQAPSLLGSDKRFAYFSAGTAEAGVELWQTDGTVAGTRMVHDLVPGAASSWPQHISFINRDVLVAAYSPAVGLELFIMPWEKAHSAVRASAAPTESLLLAAAPVRWSAERILDLASPDDAESEKNSLSGD